MTGPTDFSELAQGGVKALKPYEPGKPVSELERELGISGAIKLASNENPFGPSPNVIRVLSENLHELSRYPDGNAYYLKHALAQRHNVDPDCITIGNGSNDLLEFVARVFLGPGSGAVFSRHAFAVYPIVTQAVGAAAQIAEPFAADHGSSPYGYDPKAILSKIDATTRVVFIANPNNPTGTWLAEADLRSILESIDSSIVVVVDEAYFEYVQEADYPNTSLWLDDYPNLVVTRTFSKAYGLAGLRIGYSLSNPQIANLLNRVRQPFNANQLAQVAALEALKDQSYIQQCVEKNSAGLQQWYEALNTMGLKYIPSVCNFIAFQCTSDLALVNSELLKRGSIMRPVENYGLPNFLRVSIGSAAENQKAIADLMEIQQSGRL